ncbi:helix-turn-helix domain-containing protein [Streptomyces ovatisporus]|uniref:Helix-turn-helix domain-containing protein n=1 Tax=Streptomyces ovatisporus TaxID=1128682 RepID=A0ABV9A8Y4_9ACTN
MGRKIVQSIKEFGLLRSTALVMATLISFEAGKNLAEMVGTPSGIAGAMPISVDCLMIAALRSRRVSAVFPASILMGATNVTSHMLSHETGGVEKEIIAGVSLIPVIVLLLLELLVPAAHAASHETVSPVAEHAVIHPAASHDVSRVEDETVTELRETIAPVLEAFDETPAVSHETPTVVSPPADETQQMSRVDAIRIAEEAYAYPGTKTIKQVAAETGYSTAQINRWRKEFAKAGVKQLVTTSV